MFKKRFRGFNRCITKAFWNDKELESLVNPLTPGVLEKFMHTYTNLHLSAAGLFKYV